MKIPLQDYRALINGAALDVLEHLTEEHSIPPMFVCLHLGGFLFANIVAGYERQGLEPPKELIEFMNKTYPQMLEENNNLIETQYLTLNTEGTA